MRLLTVGMAIFGLAGVALSWAGADDKEIVKEVTERLKCEQDAGKLEGFDINMKVDEGQVLLKGHVSTPEQQELALESVRQADGVTRVVNDLEVRGQETIRATEPPVLTDKKREAKLDDSTVAAALAKSLRKLKDSGDLKDFRISFDVTDGTIVMKGTVTSNEQRELALETAKSTEGVCQVVNNLVVAEEQSSPEPRVEPTPATAVAQTNCSPVPDEDAVSDKDIAREIGAELCKQKELGTLKQFNIDLSVDNGVVVYEGRVSSAEQLDLALSIAQNADGVRDVVNNLTVVPPARKVVAKSEAEAEETVADDGGVENRLVSARSDSLRSRREAQMAEFASTPAEPVSRTTNAIYQPDAQAELSPEMVAQDQRIGEELIQKLQEAKRQGGMRGFGIGIHVNDGTVRLKGRVASSEQQHVALEIARRIRGVRLVVNELTIVEPPASEPIRRAPDAIASELGKRLQAEHQNGNLQGCDFDVEVNGGDVSLSGRVASKEQEKLAVDTARDVPGVERVISALRVAVPAGRLVSAESSPNAVAAPARANLPPMAPTAAYMVYPAVQQPAAQLAPANQTPRPLGLAQMASYAPAAALAAPLLAINQVTGGGGGGMPAHLPGPGHNVMPARYDHPNLPGYAWPSYAAHPNYAGVTYPKQYSPTAWPYIGPFYPYPQVPLGWRRVVLKWDDGWWQLNFKAK